MDKGLSLKPNHFKQYKDVAYLLLKFGQVPGSGLMKILSKNDPSIKFPPNMSDPVVYDPQGQGLELQNLISDIERMGPTFVRLGQLLALRPNLLPLPYLDALSRLGKHCAPVPFEAVRKTVEGELGRNLGDMFLSFDESPLSVSVLDQTHIAVLRTNASVVVKVQRPGVREQLYDDLQALDEVATLFDKYSGPEEKFDFHEALQTFRRTIIAELDLRQESHNLKALCNYLKHLDMIVVPTPVDNYSTSRVLVLNFLRGTKLPEAVTLNGLLKSERNKLAEQVFQAYLQQFLVDGFVHADPDPDNMMLTKDGKIAILDLGVVDRIAPAMQTKLIQLLLSINEGRADQAADLLVSMSSQRKNYSESDFRRTVSDVILANRDGGTDQGPVGQVFRGIVQATAKCGAILPWELSELGAALVKLDNVARIIDPRFDTRQFVARYVAQIMQKHMSSALSPAHIFHTVLETSEFIETLPSKISTILDSVANNNFKVTVHAIDEQVLISGFQKIANRITVGIVLAALIMGAALLMRVRTEFTILGYPGLAILAFIAAAGCGFALVVEVFLGDRTKKTS